MEWYACIGVNRGFLRQSGVSIHTGILEELATMKYCREMVVEGQVDVRQDVICGVSPSSMIFRPEPLYAPQQRVDFHSVLAGLRALFAFFSNFIQ
jgi:hypothetical protein